MANSDPSRFFNSITDARRASDGDKIDFFVYFLTVECGQPSAKPAEIQRCFEACDLRVPGRLRAHLSEGLKSKPPRYVKFAGGGYKLERHRREGLSARLGAHHIDTQASAELRKLEANSLDRSAQGFLEETIRCFEVGANRAAIVLCWIFAMDHMCDYILKHKLTAFNDALSKNKDRRVGVTEVKCRDDFAEIPEGKFIELCRSAGIISNDVRKILDQKLGIRNSSAHASAITVGRAKTVDFVEDLVANVVLKFQI